MKLSVPWISHYFFQSYGYITGDLKSILKPLIRFVGQNTLSLRRALFEIEERSAPLVFQTYTKSSMDFHAYEAFIYMGHFRISQKTSVVKLPRFTIVNMARKYH